MFQTRELIWKGLVFLTALPGGPQVKRTAPSTYRTENQQVRDKENEASKFLNLRIFKKIIGIQMKYHEIENEKQSMKQFL